MSDERKLLNDCFLHDKDRLKHAEAIAILKERVFRVVDTEMVPLLSSHGRVLAEDVLAPRSVPLTDNSAVDGYAFSHADYVAANGAMQVSASIAAGDLTPHTLAPGTAARIFTGAVMPDNADSVAMQEDCQLDASGENVIIPAGLKSGANRRKAGEDLSAGETMLAAGVRLRPQDVAALASIGQAEVCVYRKLRVALVSTGDEIIRPGEAISPGQVYDSNNALLTSLLQTQPVEIHDLGVWPDDALETERRLIEACRNHDLVLTSGGASRGDEDHVIATLDKIGSRHMWQLAIKPGRPMNFTQVQTEGGGDCVVLGLPGNPVAAMVCFLLYARLVIQGLGGMKFKDPKGFRVPAAFSIPRKKPDRREFLRGILVENDEAGFAVQKYGRDGSGLISSLREADGLIEIAEATTSVSEGELVRFVPFSQFDVV